MFLLFYRNNLHIFVQFSFDMLFIHYKHVKKNIICIHNTKISQLILVCKPLTLTITSYILQQSTHSYHAFKTHSAVISTTFCTQSMV